MKILNSTLRAVVERVTELEWHHEGIKLRLFIFEHLGQDGKSYKTWIQNWECDDVTYDYSFEEQKEIYAVIEEHYKCKATSAS